MAQWGSSPMPRANVHSEEKVKNSQKRLQDPGHFTESGGESSCSEPETSSFPLHARAASCPEGRGSLDCLDSRAVPHGGIRMKCHPLLSPVHLTPQAESQGSRGGGSLAAAPKPQDPSHAAGGAVPSLPLAAARGDVLQSSLPFSSFP